MMNADPVDALLAKLCTGDTDAAEQVFLAYEPYLRMVVRRQLAGPLRSKFDSVDIVQSVWADVLEGFRTAGWRFTDTAHLRAFLVKVTRNRFLQRVRKHRRALGREEPLHEGDIERLPPSRQDRPSELVRADELWKQMLALCPPAHRDLLDYKRQGQSLAEIAARTGLHESSVRRILYELERRLAATPAMTKDEGFGELLFGIRPSCFVILSSFVLRPSTLT
jgi:RNA polymerase sigma factor (sigma-70 family)